MDDDITIDEYESVEHWEPPFQLLVARKSARIQDKRGYTVAAVNVPAWWSVEQKVRVGNNTMTMLELRHANWELSL